MQTPQASRSKDLPDKHIERSLRLIVRHHVPSLVDLDVRNVASGEQALTTSSLDKPSRLGRFGGERVIRRLLGGLEVCLEGSFESLKPLKVTL